MGVFLLCFALLIGVEGGFTANAADPGNWTGGAVGKGKLLGTKYGISAASFPNLDIINLTLAQAQGIYQMQYWAKLCCDSLPAQLALLVFDSAVNNGVGQAARWLQAAAGTSQDGVIGTVTLQAIAGKTDLDGLCSEFSAQRMNGMAQLPTWKTFGLGWARRLCALPYKAAKLGIPIAANANNPATTTTAKAA